MATRIKPKRGTGAPTTGDLEANEIAMDMAAGKLYVNNAGTVQVLANAYTDQDALDAIEDNDLTFTTSPTWDLDNNSITFDNVDNFTVNTAELQVDGQLTITNGSEPLVLTRESSSTYSGSMTLVKDTGGDSYDDIWNRQYYKNTNDADGDEILGSIAFRKEAGGDLEASIYTGFIGGTETQVLKLTESYSKLTNGDNYLEFDGTDATLEVDNALRIETLNDQVEVFSKSDMTLESMDSGVTVKFNDGFYLEDTRFGDDSDAKFRWSIGEATGSDIFAAFEQRTGNGHRVANTILFDESATYSGDVGNHRTQVRYHGNSILVQGFNVAGNAKAPIQFEGQTVTFNSDGDTVFEGPGGVTFNADGDVIVRSNDNSVEVKSEGSGGQVKFQADQDNDSHAKMEGTTPFRFANMDTTTRNNKTASAGMVIFNTTDSKLQVYTGTAWVDLH